MQRPFRAPASPAVPLLGIAFCLLLMTGLPPFTWLRLVVWLVIGLAVYFTYGRHHSRLNLAAAGTAAPISPNGKSLWQSPHAAAMRPAAAPKASAVICPAPRRPTRPCAHAAAS